MKKGTKLYSIVNFKCPKCQQGDFFVSHPYHLNHLGDVRKNCNKCGLNYSKEPGFYFGAMYVAYALGVALFVIAWLFMNFVFPNLLPTSTAPGLKPSVLFFPGPINKVSVFFLDTIV